MKAAGKTDSNVGPIRWMSPENIRDQEYSEKSDVWAYGMTLYEIVSGQIPFDGVDLLTVATNIRDHGSVPEIPLDCPDFLIPVIQQCWATDPANIFGALLLAGAMPTC
jgi:serine/threonine protein kinase